MTLKTITVDGLPVETTDAGIAAIEKLRGLLAVSDAAVASEKAAHEKTKAEKEAEAAKKDAEIEELKKKVVEDAALDALVADRAAVVTKAKALDPNVVTDGKTNMEIKRAVLGESAKDKPDAYVDAAFDLKQAETVDDTVRDAIRHTDHSSQTNDAWGNDIFDRAGVAQAKKGA